MDIQTLTALNTATCIEDMGLPGFRLHSLKENRKGFWAIDVSKNCPYLPQNRVKPTTRNFAI